MSQPQKIAPPRWLKPANKVLIGLQRAGLRLGGMHLLTVPGRKSGQPRTTPTELPAEEARPVLRAFPAEVPTGVSFIKDAGLVKNGTPEEFEALAGRCVVFRFDPIDNE